MKDGGPAYPTVPLNHGYSPEVAGEGTGSQSGMSLRDYLAGQALVGIMLYDEFWTVDKTHKDGEDPIGTYTARLAYAMADAMIEQREKPIIRKVAKE